MYFKKSLVSLLFIIFTNIFFSGVAESANLIQKSDFNFGHQLGYIYSGSDSAYFAKPGTWVFTTGLCAYYTPEMPLVRNPKFKERLLILSPIALEVIPCNGLSLFFGITDAFIEFPYVNIHNTGGTSPIFKVKMELVHEKRVMPAFALTLGVKFSSAKPFTIWDFKHNYDESNGLAGAGTGVADYLIQFAFSKRIYNNIAIHSRLGLAPLGSPVEYVRGSGQADEIPYGLAIDGLPLTGRTSGRVGVWGMYNGLKSTTLAHYSVARVELIRQISRINYTLKLEKGLTKESDQYNIGLLLSFNFLRKSW